jgi:hypothetical protein
VIATASGKVFLICTVESEHDKNKRDMQITQLHILLLTVLPIIINQRVSEDRY